MENKTSKPSLPAGRYFKYAIGEIILVVIGILIALQVNNWNEKRVKLKNEKNLITSIVDEVKASKINLSTSLKQNSKILNDMSLYLDDQLPETDKESPKLIYLASHNNIDTEIPLILSVLENNETTPLSDTHLLQLLRELNSLYKKMNINEAFLDDFWNSNTSEFLIRKKFALSVVDQVVRKKTSKDINFKALYDDDEYKNLISIKWILHNTWVLDQKKTLNQLNKILDYLETSSN
ncbi:hypothetical protein Q2T40_13665 [Winogradskyella maritima]|uniref:Uncharacterized protein n=1 Tax=Winogradskyella maritima TaxID=1517766 RepID=A0ABV8AIF9_9FLAO|nr:hypothetical protein [Winogradskyella maritima]